MKQMIASWSMVMVHGLMVAGPGLVPRFHKILWSRVRRGAPSIFGSQSNVVYNQADYLPRPGTEAPETQIYCTNHRSGANSVPRVRTVVRGERASRSIVNRTTALWSIWMVASLILAGAGSELLYTIALGRGFVVSRGSNGRSKIAQCALSRLGWTLPPTNGRKRT